MTEDEQDLVKAARNLVGYLVDKSRKDAATGNDKTLAGLTEAVNSALRALDRNP